MPSPSAEPVLGDADLDALFDIADAAIIDGLRGRRRAPPLDRLPDALRRNVNAFVTLTVDGALNGCIGGVDAGEPLGVAVAHHAWSAAFADPRLAPLRADEYDRLLVEISLLSALEPVPAGSREQLLSQLRAHVDGLVIAHGARRGLFLPAVWEQLPRPGDFVDHLLLKAGLAQRPWPAPGAWRFTATRYARKAGARTRHTA